MAGSSSRVITSNGVTYNFPITNSSTGTVQLFDNLTLASTRTFIFNSGTLDLNGKVLSTGLFSSNNSTTRTIAFGSGNITCTGSGAVWATDTVIGLTVTGTPIVNISNNSATATTVTPGPLSEANSISFNFTVGTYSLTFLTTAGYTAKNVDFTGFAGTWAARTVASTVYGSLTLSTGMTFAASSGILTLGATSGTQVVTTNGKTFDEPLTINGVGGTVQLADALTMGASRALTLTNGTFDGNSKTISGASSFTPGPYKIRLPFRKPSYQQRA